jgi:aromatic-L-amino-acid decarboxylase
VQFPLEPDRETMRAWGEAVLAFVVDHVEALARAPASDYRDLGPLLKQLGAAPSETPASLRALLGLVDEAASKGLTVSGPGYLAYVPGGGLYSAALADFVAKAINRYVTVPEAGPAVAAIEASVTRWMCDLFGLPPGSAGVLTTGGSLANFSAIVSARHALLGESFLDGVLYVGAHAHHSVAKAASLAGFPAAAVRVVGAAGELRLDPGRLRAAIASDRRAGLRPAAIVASAGSTDTGSVDPLEPIADLAAAEQLWLHVDAAYGGFFQLTERGRRILSGIERADSITLDPHKGLFIPLGTGALVVRDGEALRASHGGGGSYLRDLDARFGVPHFAELSPELSRDFRGLRVWLPLHLHGVAAFRAALDEKLDLAGEAYAALSRIPELEVLEPPDLSVVAFRARGEPPRADRASERVLRRVNESGRVVLSSTLVDGRLTLRMAILSHRTHRPRVLEALELIERAAREAQRSL